MKEYSEN